MSAGAQAIAAKPRQAPMSGFERYLTLWVACASSPVLRSARAFLTCSRP